MNVQFNEGFRENGPFAEMTQWPSLNVLKDEIYFMILDDGVLVLDYIFMVETFENIDLFFDGADVLFADGDLFQGHKYAVIEIDTLVDLSVGSFSYFLDQLIAFDSFTLSQTTHSIINIIISFRNKILPSFQ